MAVRCTVSAVARACRIEWHSVGGICGRILGDLRRATGPARSDGVRGIGIDETSHKKGHRYLMVVVDHDRGCLIWAAGGWSKEELRRFLKEELTREQRLSIEVVTADGYRWI